MCKLSGNKDAITTTKFDKYSKNKSVLTTHYTGNAKCEPRSKTTKLNGNRTFECRPLTHRLDEKKPNSDWETIISILLIHCNGAPLLCPKMPLLRLPMYLDYSIQKYFIVE
jgi:hypothetical protein